MPELAQGKRNYYFDFLASVACFFIVVTHHGTADITKEPALKYGLSYAISNFSVSFLPVFFMLSGAKLIGYEEKYDTRTFFKRRAKKVLIPFLVFAIFSFVQFYVRTPEYFEHKTVLMCLASFDYLPVYWFFEPLFLLYLLMPFITKVRFLNDRQYLFLLLVLFFTEAFLPLIAAFAHVKMRFLRNGILSVVLYAILGYYLAERDKFDKHYWILAVLAVVSLAFRNIWPYLTVDTALAQVEVNNYWSFLCLIPCVFYFLTAKRIGLSHPDLCSNRSFRLISASSLGIYLIHYYVRMFELIFVKSVIGWSWSVTDQTWWFMFLMPFVTFGISLFAVYISRRTRLGRILFP